MLKSVRFKNFKIFKNETIIDLTASKSEILKETNVQNGVLKGGIFYGGNASGKTTALNAISILLDLLFKEFSFNNVFACSFSKDKTTFFEYTFLIDNNEIIYYIEFNRDGNIVKEVLKLNRDIYLERIGTSATTKLTYNTLYESDDVDSKTLFIRKIYFNTKFSEFNVLSKWMDYLKNSIYFNFMAQVTFSNKTQQDVLLGNYLEKYGVKDINDFFNEFNIPYEIEYNKKVGLPINIFTNIIFKNKIINNDIPYMLESNGNQMLLNLMPSILTIIKTGGILAIDEFGCVLHNKLEELLINYLYKKTSNVQVFVVSHSTNLLKTSIVRPDQIFVVDFDENGGFISKASSASPRESQNLEKMYLAGVFGGLPIYEPNKD